MIEKEEKFHQLARSLVTQASAEERESLLTWASGLIEIRKSDVSLKKKLTSAIKLTLKSKIIWPILKRTTKDLKRLGWDERSWKARLGGGGAVATLVALGNAGAGIAALGGAIGVPLWIVFGAGGAFAGLVIDEIYQRQKPPKSTYTIIDVDKSEDS